jgi:Holliday junction resolvase RusA-like endonuclease
MTDLFTDGEVAALLRRQGVPEDRIARQLGARDQTTTARPQYPVPPAPGLPAECPTAPILLRIPWSALVSDNAKSRAALRGTTATIVLTPAYREAKQRIRALCQDVMAGRPPLTIPLALEARVWVPDRHRRDVVNFSKALHDALTGTVFLDDSQLHDVRWLRAGVDVDAPRAELTITPIPAAA